MGKSKYEIKSEEEHQALMESLRKQRGEEKGCGKVICANTDYDNKMVICGSDFLIDTQAIRAAEITFMLEWYILEIDKRRMISRWTRQRL